MSISLVNSDDIKKKLDLKIVARYVNNKENTSMFSVRAANCLESVGITTIKDLISKKEEDLYKIKNCGKTVVREIRNRLMEMGLSLGMNLDAIENYKFVIKGLTIGRIVYPPDKIEKIVKGENFWEIVYNNGDKMITTDVITIKIEPRRDENVNIH